MVAFELDSRSRSFGRIGLRQLINCLSADEGLHSRNVLHHWTSATRIQLKSYHWSEDGMFSEYLKSECACKCKVRLHGIIRWMVCICVCMSLCVYAHILIACACAICLPLVYPPPPLHATILLPPSPHPSPSHTAPPSVGVTPSEPLLSVGDALTLTCTGGDCVGIITINFSWLLDGSPVDTSLVTVINSTTSQLSVTSVTSADFGTYTCQVMSVHGTGTAVADIRERGISHVYLLWLCNSTSHVSSVSLGQGVCTTHRVWWAVPLCVIMCGQQSKPEENLHLNRQKRLL